MRRANLTHFHRLPIWVSLIAMVVCHIPCLADEASTSANTDNDQQERPESQPEKIDSTQPSSAGSPALRPSGSLDVYSFGGPVDPSGNYGGYTSLYADHKARRVGDTVTIVIAESSKASKSASTKTSKKSGSNSNLSDLFGLGGLPLKMGADAQSDYAGSGSTTRSGSMEATISATVKEVLPNGNLLLEGTRKIAVNDDVQTITVSGVVRPQSINSDNSVLSSYIADAEITYEGEGPTAQRPGIVTRILQTPFHWVASIFRKIF